MDLEFVSPQVQIAIVALICLVPLLTYAAHRIATRPSYVGHSGTSGSYEIPRPSVRSQLREPVILSDDAEVTQQEEDHIPSTNASSVEFAVYAPQPVPHQSDFQIRLRVRHFMPPAPSGRLFTGGYNLFDTIVLKLKDGDYVQAQLISDALDVDAPIQTLEWQSRDLTILFVSRVRDTHRERLIQQNSALDVKAKLLISVFNTPVGIIPFNLKIAKSPNREIDLQLLANKGAPFAGLDVLALAAGFEGCGRGSLLYKDVILLYVTEDRNDVTRFAEGLAAGGARPKMDQSHLFPDGQRWEKKIEDIMRDCHAAVLCLSEHSDAELKTDGSHIRKELNMALAQEMERETFVLIPYVIGTKFIPPPHGIKARTATSPFFHIRKDS